MKQELEPVGVGLADPADIGSPAGVPPQTFCHALVAARKVVARDAWPAPGSRKSAGWPAAIQSSQAWRALFLSTSNSPMQDPQTNHAVGCPACCPTIIGNACPDGSASPT